MRLLLLGLWFWFLLRLASEGGHSLGLAGSWVEAGGTREDTGGEDQIRGGSRSMGWAGRILVTRCYGGGRGAEVAGWARGAEGPGDVESRDAGELQRGFWGCSGDRLREGLRAGRIRG